MSKKTLPCPTAALNAEHNRWAEWRKNNRPGEDEREPVEVFRVRKIAQALDDLRWANQSEKPSPSALEIAVCDDRWDLIHKATALLEREWLPRLDPRRLSHDGKWIAFCLTQLESPKLGKADILEYIKTVHPEIFATIPSTLKARTTWWAEVGGDQVRAAIFPEWKRQFKALIATAISNREAGFPDYLGPRENPNWD